MSEKDENLVNEVANETSQTEVQGADTSKSVLKKQLPKLKAEES